MTSWSASSAIRDSTISSSVAVPSDGLHVQPPPPVAMRAKAIRVPSGDQIGTRVVLRRVERQPLHPALGQVEKPVVAAGPFVAVHREPSSVRRKVDARVRSGRAHRSAAHAGSVDPEERPLLVGPGGCRGRATGPISEHAGFGKPRSSPRVSAGAGIRTRAQAGTPSATRTGFALQRERVGIEGCANTVSASVEKQVARRRVKPSSTPRRRGACAPSESSEPT